jgi:NAD(P)-dependent dehydrogenase (short-subunit alcohol dehydrogenase family)
MSDLKGRVALVTGGGSGMGLASCQAFADHGATVIVADRDGQAADHAAAEIVASGGEAIGYHVDVSSVAELRAMFDFIGQRFGRLNVLFSNAGVKGPMGLDVTEEEFDEVLNLNLKSHLFATNMAVPLMRPCATEASIIYMSSAGGLRVSGRRPLYSISKAAVITLMRSVAKTLGPDKIRANAICPGHIDTPFARIGFDEQGYEAALENSNRTVPMGRIGKPADIASVALFLASDQSAYISGVAMPVDGGLTA